MTLARCQLSRLRCFYDLTSVGGAGIPLWVARKTLRAATTPRRTSTRTSLPARGESNCTCHSCAQSSLVMVLDFTTGVVTYCLHIVEFAIHGHGGFPRLKIDLLSRGDGRSPRGESI